MKYFRKFYNPGFWSGGLVAMGIHILFGQLHLSYLAGVGAFMIYFGLVISYLTFSESKL